MTINNQEDAFDAIVARLLPSIVKDIEDNATQPIQTVVRLIRERKEVRNVSLSPSITDGKVGKGEIRIVIKPPSDLGRFSFSAQAVFRDVAEGTGFSGFAIRGKIALGQATSEFRVTSRSNRYNVWAWEEQFILTEETSE